MKGKECKRLRQLAIAVLTLFLPLSGVQTSFAQSENDVTLRVGVIDMRNIIQRSNAMITIRAALDEQNAQFQQSISQEELELRQAERELNDLQSSLTEDEFAGRLKEFEERVIAIQRSIQSQKLSFDRSIQQAQSQLEQELLNIVSEIAQERSLSMVLQRQNVVIYNNALDITDDALARLNEKTKNLTLTRQSNNDTQNN